MYRILVNIILFAFLLQVANGQRIKSGVNIVELLPNQEIPVNSVVYSLPKTLVKVDVVVEKMVCRAGVLNAYSENMLNLPAIAEDMERWEIKQILISTVGKADNSKRYAVSASGEASAQFITLSSNGTLLGLNMTPSNALALDSPILIEKELVSADISFSDVPMLEKQLKTTSLPAMATSAAEMIYKLRKRQLKMVGFEYEHHPCDMPLMKYSIEELAFQEKQFTELFVGKCKTQEIIKSFVIDINEMKIDSGLLFTFSPEKGFVESGDAFTFKCVGYEKSSVKALVETKSNKKQRGLVYNLPINIEFSILNSQGCIASKQIQVAMPGVTADISPKILIKKGVSVYFDESTGALKSIQRLAD